MSHTTILTLPAFVAVLMLPCTAFAFRTGRDVPALAGTERVRFKNDVIAFALAPMLPTNLSQSDVERAIHLAATTWSAADCTAVAFSYSGMTAANAAPGDGVNTVEWVSDWAARGFRPNAAGQTDVQYERINGQWVIQEADVYLNTAFQWTTGSPATGDLRSVQSVVTHELGHVLGLQHPCEFDASNGAPLCAPGRGDSYAQTTMYPLYSESEETLSQDDVNGVCFLYPSSDCSLTGCPLGQTCTDLGCTAACGSDTCLPNERCTTQGCRSTSNNCNGIQCVGDSCSIDVDCGIQERCTNGLCSAETVPTGDPCSTDAECNGGSCLGAACASLCNSNNDCSMDASCFSSGSPDTAGVCVSQLAPFGAACESASDCTGGFCVSGGSAAPICSRSCGMGHPGCPSGSQCDLIDGNSVCAPIPKIRHNCSIGMGTDKRSDFSIELITTGISIYAFRRRRSRETGWRTR